MNNINIDLYSAVFDRVTDKYLMHYGTPLMKWRQHGEGKRWQSHAVYAQGKPNPNARVRGEKETKDAVKRMSLRSIPAYDAVPDWGRAKYPKQTLKDLRQFDGAPTHESRLTLNHPSWEKYTGPGRHYNCPNCAAAFDMHERGYDVIARTARNGSNVGEIEKMYEGGSLRKIADGSDIPKLQQLWRDRKVMFKDGKDGKQKYFEELDRQQGITADNTIKAISSQPIGARGTIVVGWMESPEFPQRTTSYHAFNYKNEKDGVKFYDVQSGKKNSLMGMPAKGCKEDGFFLDIDPREVYIMRTDNLEPTEAIMSAVYSPDRSRLQHSEETGINVELYSKVFDRVRDKYLMHTGEKGMHWRQHGEGKRWQSHAVYAQGLPDPNAVREKTVKAISDSGIKTKQYNMDSFKKDADHNTLYISGYSGSGKSTIAYSLRGKDTNVIHLDAFFDANVDADTLKNRDKEFVKYLEKENPDFKKMNNPKLHGTAEFGRLLEDFEKSIDNFSRTQYGKGKSVVVEGLQLLDDTLYPDKSYFKDKPVVIAKTGAVKSFIRAGQRDSKLTLPNFTPSEAKQYYKWYKEMRRQINGLESYLEG